VRFAYHGTFVAANNTTFVYSIDNKPSNLARNSARNLLAGSEFNEVWSMFFVVVQSISSIKIIVGA